LFIDLIKERSLRDAYRSAVAIERLSRYGKAAAHNHAIVMKYCRGAVRALPWKIDARTDAEAVGGAMVCAA